MRKITKISKTPTQSLQRKRVAAYARVSSDKEAMIDSLSAQVSYYSSLLQKRGDWKYAGVYADEGLTGTKDARPEFQRLLEDCRAGKIDMVITKSITRFARNTVLLLETVRELKQLGIDVFFERENIHSISSDGELMLTFLASYAQEESRSASENQKWRIRKMFEAGRPNTGRMLGYRLVDGKLHVIPEEAEIVKMIYTDYLSGMGLNAIMKKLRKLGLPVRFSKAFDSASIHKILRNEKYTGDLLLQKTYSSDHISKKKMINRGELPMYEVLNSHQAIIDKETFNKVQEELAQRARKWNSNTHPRTRYPFTSFIRCELCGQNYRRKIVNAGSKYAKPAWICPTFNMQGKEYCSSQQIPEKILMQKTAEVLGLAEFDEAAFVEYIAEIRVPEHNRLIYVFSDGHTEEVAWENPSRRESWTEEMKQVARERQKSIEEKRRKYE